MQIALGNIAGVVIAYLSFGFFGLRLSRKFKQPVSLFTWLILALAALLALFLLPHAILVGIFEVKVFVSTALHATAIGVLIGLVIREIRPKPRKGTPD